MNSKDYPLMICRTCHHALDVVLNGDGAHYVHTAADADDHEVIAVTPTEGWHGRCDFCSDISPTHVLPAKVFALPDAPEHMSQGNWAACDPCANLLRNERWDWLLARVIANFHATYGFPMPKAVQAHVSTLYRALQLAVTGALRRLDDTSSAPSSEHGHG